MDWIIALPSTAWSKHREQLQTIEDGYTVVYFSVVKMPEEMEMGDRLWLLWKGKIKGWIKISYFGRMRRFHCKTTDKHLPEGLYVQVSGRFHEIKGKKMRGFKGIRKYND